MRSTMRNFLMAILLLCATQSQLRAQLPERDVENRALQQITSKVFPGAEIRGNGDILLRDSGGSVKHIIASGLLIRDLPEGFVFVAGLEVGEDRDRAINATLSFKSTPTSITQIVIFFTDHKGNVGSHKVGSLDSQAAVTKLVDFYWPDTAKAGSWPVLLVTSGSWYKVGDTAVAVRWSTRIDTATMQHIERIPLALEKKSKGGSSFSDVLAVERTSTSAISIQATNTGRTVSYPCGDICIVDGPKLAGYF